MVGLGLIVMTTKFDLFLVWLSLIVLVTSRNNSSRELKNQGVTKADGDGVGFLPNIFIVGGQKCGSSSLFELLMKHPLLSKGTHKEPHFFDGENEFKKGLHYYTNTFFPMRKGEENNPRQRFMDGTPIFHKPIVWERIYNSLVPYVQCAGLKFIVLLREPVARDLSWYSHQTREQIFLGEPFSEVQTLKEKASHVFTTKKKLTEEEQELFDKTFRGQYIDQLEAFTKIFHRNQIFVVNIMSIVKNSTMVLEHLRKV